MVDAAAGFAKAALHGGLAVAPVALVVSLGYGSRRHFRLAGKACGDQGFEPLELFLDGLWLGELARPGSMGLRWKG